MNYYNPNFYQNYQPQYIPQPQQQQPIQMVLSGKMVDSVETAKVADVPIGGYGVFPKADMSEVYVKTWNQNGTTSLFTYRPVEPEPPQENNLDTILTKINQLECKLDDLLNKKEGKHESNTINSNFKTEF